MTDSCRRSQAGLQGNLGYFLVTGWSFWQSTPKTCRKNSSLWLWSFQNCSPLAFFCCGAKGAGFLGSWAGQEVCRRTAEFLQVKSYVFINLCTQVVLLSLMTLYLFSSLQSTQHQVSYYASLCRGWLFPYGFIFTITAHPNTSECTWNGLKTSFCPAQSSSGSGNRRNGETLAVVSIWSPEDLPRDFHDLTSGDDMSCLLLVRDAEGSRSTWLNTSKGSVWRWQRLGLPLSFGKVLLSDGVGILGGGRVQRWSLMCIWVWWPLCLWDPTKELHNDYANNQGLIIFSYHKEV